LKNVSMRKASKRSKPVRWFSWERDSFDQTVTCQNPSWLVWE
jgi:hypothetical protein